MKLNNKRILIVTPHFYPLVTGYSNGIVNFIKNFDKYSKNSNVTVLCNDALGDHLEFPLKNGFVVRVKVPNYKSKILSFLFLETKLFIKILSLDRQKPYDLILFETMERSFCLFLISCSRLAYKVGVRIQGCIETEFYIWAKQFQFRVRRFLVSLAIRNIRYIFSASPFYLDFFKKHYLHGNVLRIARKNFYILENLMSEYDGLSNGELVLKRLGLKENRFFLSVGRMDFNGAIQKGVTDFLQAVFLLSIESPELLADFRFVLVGEGEYANKFSNLAKKLKIDTHCIFLSRLENSDIRALQPYSRAVVMNSRFEGTGVFTMEGLYGGSLLLLSDIGGLRDLAYEGVNGYFVEPQNIIQLKEKIECILMLSDEKIAKMKQESRILYNNKFNPENVIQKFENIVEFIKRNPSDLILQ